MIMTTTVTLNVEVLWAMASVVVTFVGLFSLVSLGSFQTLLLILRLLPRGA
jgi:hypothetical protein